MIPADPSIDALRETEMARMESRGHPKPNGKCVEQSRSTREDPEPLPRGARCVVSTIRGPVSRDGRAERIGKLLSNKTDEVGTRDRGAAEKALDRILKAERLHRCDFTTMDRSQSLQPRFR
jgi:hypothetical protein